MNVSYTNLMGIALLYLVVWCISPPLSYGTIYRVLAVVVITVSVILCQRKRRVLISKYQFHIMLLMAYIFGVSWIVGDGINHRIGTYIFLFILLVSECLWEERFDIRKMYFIIPLAFILFTIWNVRTLQGIAEVPNIMRLLAKNSAMSETYIKSGIGGYGYMYTVIFLLPVGLDCIFSYRRNMIYRLLAIPYVVTTYMLSFQSQYFLALLIVIFLTVLFFGLQIKIGGLRFIIISASLVAFIVLYMNAGEVLLYLREIVDIRSIQLKLDSMYELIVNDGSLLESEFYTRYDRYTDSLLYALQHPLLGGFTYKVTGNHSHIFDFVAQFGIPIGIFYIRTITRPFMRMDLKSNTCSLVVLASFMVTILMNTLAYAFAAVVYILVPVYYHYSKERINYV